MGTPRFKIFAFLCFLPGRIVTQALSGAEWTDIVVGLDLKGSICIEKDKFQPNDLFEAEYYDYDMFVKAKK